jgi:hypothetical protein
MKINDNRQLDSGYDCKEIRDLLLLYVLNQNDLSLDERNHIGSHLEKCASCREEYEQTKFVNDVLIANRDYFIGEGAFGDPKPENSSEPMSDEEVDFLQFQGKLQRALARRKRAERRAKWDRLRPALKVASIVAACLVIGLGIFWAVSQSNKASNNSQPVASGKLQDAVKIELIAGSQVEILSTDQPIIALNEIKTLRINDNRQVVLNIGTQLSIELYNLGCIVKLDKGEIYAEVEHDGKPFIVETIHGRAVITGTTFNIKADREKMELAVVEGSVRFESGQGNVNVIAGYKSSVAAGMSPTRPVAFDIKKIANWAKTPDVTQQANQNTLMIDASDLPGIMSIYSPYRNLEEIDFDVWIEQRREWFEREFPWTKRLQRLLARNGIQVDTIDLLIESGDLWRFAWPQHSRMRILSEDVLIIQPIADRYGIHIPDGWIPGGKKQALGTAGIQEWLDALDGSNGDLILDSIYAATFMLNTRSLAWFAVHADKIHVQDNGKVLGLLTEQVRCSSQALGILNELLLADKNMSVCSVSEYDVAKEKLRSTLSSIMEFERELAGYEVVSK